MEIVEEIIENIFDKQEKEESQTHVAEQTDLFVVMPPDGGWGWMVVTAAFFSYLISDGIIYTFGIFLINMAESFDCSPSKVALTGAIMTGFFCLTGPFIAALVNQFGCRKIAIIGSLIASISCFLTSTSSSLSVSFLTHGIMGGMGFGMIYMAAVIAVGFYFEKWRALATSIAVCGAGIGGIALPPLLSLILDKIGWRYSFKIMAILSFSCAFCGLFYKPLKPIKIDNEATRGLNKNKKLSDRFQNPSHFFPLNSESRNEAKSIQLDHNNLSSFSQAIIGDVYSTDIKPCMKYSDFYAKLHPTNSDDQPTSTVTIFKSHKLPRNISSEFIMSETLSTSSRSSFRSGKSSKHESSIENVHSTKNADSRLSTVYEESKSNGCCGKVAFDCKLSKAYCKKTCFCCQRAENTVSKHITRPLYRDDIFYSASLIFLPEYRKSMYVSQPKVAPSVLTSTQISKASLEYNMLITRTVTQKEINEGNTCTLWSESIKRTLAMMLDFSLLKSPSFLLLIFNAIFTSLGFYTPYMFIKDRAIHHGIPKHLAFWLISGIGVTNTLGRIACGIISSFPTIRAITITYVSLLIGGLATLLSGLSYNIWIQFGYTALYGISVACMSALRTIIIVEMLGLQKLTNAIGIILMFQGVASLVGTSISGFLRDITGDYQSSFYFAGGCITIGSLLLIPIRQVSAWEKQKKEDFRNLN